MIIEITKEGVVRIKGTGYQLDVTAFMLLSMSVNNNPERLSRIQEFVNMILPGVAGLKVDTKEIIHPFVKATAEKEVSE